MSPMPSRAILWAADRPFLAVEDDAPLAGGVKPMMERMVVVLPMPLRPSRATMVASFTSRDTPCRM